MTVAIPGLIPQAFARGSPNTAPTPQLVRARIDKDTGRFKVEWNAKGSQVYRVTANGVLRIVAWTEQHDGSALPVFDKGSFHASCDCPDGTRQQRFNERHGQTSGSYVQLRVCKHAAAALESVLDPEAIKEYEDRKTKMATGNGNHKHMTVSVSTATYSSLAKKETVSTADNVIDLSNEDDIAETGNQMGIKRPPSGIKPETLSESANKRQKFSMITKAGEAPIKLFATKSDVAMRSRYPHDQEHWSKTQCWTLREMLGYDGNYSAGIQWIVIATYLLDAEFLLDEVPELLQVPEVAVLYGHADSPLASWKSASVGSFHAIQIDPSDDPGPANPIGTRIPYGVHHTKCFLVGFSDGTLRVVIHTANLGYSDIHLKTQSAYLQHFPSKTPASCATCSFEDDLVSYFDSYRLQRATTTWVRNLSDRLRRYNYESANVVLIPSIPGYHAMGNGSPLLGHLKLRQAISNHTTDSSRSNESECPIVCQFSSIGSLTEKYLHELQKSMDFRLARQSREAESSANLRLKFIYPTVEEIRSSVEGYCGGGAVPGTTKNLSKPFLGPLFHKWSTPDTGNPLWKGSNVPHIKTYYQIAPDETSLKWMVISSHNVSKAAWGDVVNSTKYGGKRFFVRHWELGVFISPKLLNSSKILPWSPNSSAQAREDKNISTVPIPYKVLPDSYGPQDRPWAADQRYFIPDRYGRTSVMG